MGKYKMSFGRKFWTCLVILAILCAMFFVTLVLHPAAMTPSVISLFIVMIVTMGFMYVGGNIWKSWIKSKYFHNEMTGGP